MGAIDAAVRPPLPTSNHGRSHVRPPPVLVRRHSSRAPFWRAHSTLQLAVPPLRLRCDSSPVSFCALAVCRVALCTFTSEPPMRVQPRVALVALAHSPPIDRRPPASP
eukprot:6444601-Prymnesium_polylepis.1